MRLIRINNYDFKLLFNNDNFSLPRLRKKKEFEADLEELYTSYLRKLSLAGLNRTEIQTVKNICDKIKLLVSYYHNGFPHKSYEILNELMKVLDLDDLEMQKTSMFYDNVLTDPLKLYRIRNVIPRRVYERKELFHTPYSLRANIRTSRYSIAGFPCLYLGTRLELCCKESKVTDIRNTTIVSRYQLRRNHSQSKIRINVIDLGIKPRDFFTNENNLSDGDLIVRKMLDNKPIHDTESFSKFIYRYPLIAACSFIRNNKEEPFASEYIVPQILMQWVRQKTKSFKTVADKLVGIRYFSCESLYSSRLGYNYVFPSSGTVDEKYNDYCAVLSKAFRLTKPRFIDDYADPYKCIEQMDKDQDFQFI